MGMIKEPLTVDFEVENRPLTKEEEKLISEYIKHRQQQKKLDSEKSNRKSIKGKREKV